MDQDCFTFFVYVANQLLTDMGITDPLTFAIRDGSSWHSLDENGNHIKVRSNQVAFTALVNAGKAELEAYYNPLDYRTDEQTHIGNIITDYVAEANDSFYQSGITAALNRAKGKIDATKTAAQYDAEEAAAVVALINAIGEVTLESESAIFAARSAYDLLTPGGEAFVTNYTTLTNAEARLTELVAAKSAADVVIAAIAALPAVDSIALTDEQDIVDAREAYEALTTDGQNFVNNLSVLEAAEAKLAELKAADALAQAKADAKAELASYADSNNYREAEQELLATALENGNDDIDGANTIARVEEALDEAKAAIDEIKTKAQYEAEEAAARLAAKAELAAYKDADDYREAEQTLLANAISDGNTAIDAATSIAGVEEALANAKGVIDAIKTKAQYEAEEAEAAAALQAKKDRAISAINNYYDTLLETEQYTNANKAALLEAKNNAIAAINAATTIEEVNAAATAGQTALDAVEKIQPTPEPQPEPEQPDQGGEQEQPAKKGCKSSVLAASALISTLALAGFGLLISKKRKED